MCNPKVRKRIGQTGLFSDGTTTAVFVPVTAAFSTNELNQVAADFEMMGSTGAFGAKPAVRYGGSPSAVLGGSVTEFGSELTANGVSHVAFTSLPGTPLGYAQLGFNSRNTSGVARQRASVWYRFHFRLQ